MHTSMHTLARSILIFSAILITLGSLYDLFSPRLPPNLVSICHHDPQSTRLARELLRALGGALLAIGLSFLWIALESHPPLSPLEVARILLLVLPAEGVNAYAMRRVGSPWQIPTAFIVLTVLGATLSLLP